MPSEVAQASLLPSVDDPKLFVVQCKTGHEHEVKENRLVVSSSSGASVRPLLVRMMWHIHHA